MEDAIPRTPPKTGKRTDYLSWDEYFMSVAFLSAQRSKDPSSQVGACVVNADKKIVGIGYNGMPNGCSDDELPWRRHGEDELETKYPYGKLIRYLITGQFALLQKSPSTYILSPTPQGRHTWRDKSQGLTVGINKTHTWYT